MYDFFVACALLFLYFFLTFCLLLQTAYAFMFLHNVDWATWLMHFAVNGITFCSFLHYFLMSMLCVRTALTVKRRWQLQFQTQSHRGFWVRLPLTLMTVLESRRNLLRWLLNECSKYRQRFTHTALLQPLNCWFMCTVFPKVSIL